MIKALLITIALVVTSIAANITATAAQAPQAAEATDIQYDLRVDGITCPFCVAKSETALKAIDGVKHVWADLKAGIISVCTASTVVFTDQQLTALFLEKGFTYKGMTKSDSCTN